MTSMLATSFKTSSSMGSCMGTPSDVDEDSVLMVFVESGREVTEVPNVVEGTVVVLAPAIGFEDMVVEEAREDREEVRREIIEDIVWLSQIPPSPRLNSVSRVRRVLKVRKCKLRPCSEGWFGGCAGVWLM